MSVTSNNATSKREIIKIKTREKLTVRRTVSLASPYFNIYPTSNTLMQFLFKENVRYPVWTCRDPISLILGSQFSLILGTR